MQQRTLTCLLEYLYDIQVETQKDRSLRRRIQSLQIFLFEQLHRELLQGQSEKSNQPVTDTAPSPDKFASDLDALSSSPSKPDAAITETALAAEPADATSAAVPGAKPSSRPLQPAPQVDSPDVDVPLKGQDDRTVVDHAFGLMVRQRTRCLAQHKAQKLREFRSFQVGSHHSAAQVGQHRSDHWLSWQFQRCISCFEADAAVLRDGSGHLPSVQGLMSTASTQLVILRSSFALLPA